MDLALTKGTWDLFPHRRPSATLQIQWGILFLLSSINSNFLTSSRAWHPSTQGPFQVRYWCLHRMLVPSSGLGDGWKELLRHCHGSFLDFCYNWARTVLSGGPHCLSGNIGLVSFYRQIFFRITFAALALFKSAAKYRSCRLNSSVFVSTCIFFPVVPATRWLTRDVVCRCSSSWWSFNSANVETSWGEVKKCW